LVKCFNLNGGGRLSYSEPSDVRRLIETALSDDEIAEIIELCDAEIDRRIGPQNPSDPLIRRLSSLLAARTIKLREPKARAIGEYREESGDVLDIWGREIERIYRLYEAFKFSSTSYRYMEESRP